jgi:hypothetical protein
LGAAQQAHGYHAQPLLLGRRHACWHSMLAPCCRHVRVASTPAARCVQIPVTATPRRACGPRVASTPAARCVQIPVTATPRRACGPPDLLVEDLIRLINLARRRPAA